MLLKISLTPVWTSLFWHSSMVPSLTSLHVSTPSATPSSSSMNSLSSRTPPHRREVWWESGCQGTVLTHGFFNEPGVCKIWGVRRRGWVGCRERSSPYWKISWCSVLGGEGLAGGTVEGIQPQNTPPHVVSIRNNLVFTHHWKERRAFLGQCFFTDLLEEKKGPEIWFRISVFRRGLRFFSLHVIYT